MAARWCAADPPGLPCRGQHGVAFACTSATLLSLPVVEAAQMMLQEPHCHRDVCAGWKQGHAEDGSVCLEHHIHGNPKTLEDGCYHKLS